MVYVICYLEIIFGYLFVKSKFISLKQYCIFTSVFFIGIVGLRNIYLGITDTSIVYIPRFNNIYHYGWDYTVSIDKDMGFQIVTYIFTKLFGNNEILYLIIMGAPYIISVSFLIYKYSKHPMLSFIVFLSLNYFSLGFTIMRQVIAMSILMVSFHYIIKRKKWKFILSVLLASLFHKVSIIFLIVYPISKLQFRKIYLGVIPLCLGCAILLPNTVKQMMLYFFKDDTRWSGHITNAITLNLTNFMICLMFVIIGIIYLRSIIKDRINVILLYMSILASSFAPFSIIIRELGRVSYIFGIFNIILLPNILMTEKNYTTRNIMILVACYIFIIYFFCFLGVDVNILPYKFYWQ